MSDTAATETADTGGDQTTATTTTADTTTTTATDTASAETQTDQTTTQADQKTVTTEQKTEYKVPDAYKDKPWAAKIKSEDDLYKQLDNLSVVAGKKNLYPSADATPEEMDKYFEGLRPESTEKYDFGADHPNPEFAKSVGEVLFAAGISEHQAKKIIPAYNALEQKIMEAATSAEGFKAEMTATFGEKYDASVAAVVKEHKQHLKPEDQQLMDAIPNKYLGMIYRLTNAMQKAYGAEEGGADAHAAKGGAPIGEDITAKRSTLRGKIAELDGRFHTADEKQRLLDELQATYTTQGKK